jgi:hypothetical protein
MPLQKQVLDIPLAAGLDQKLDVRGLQADGAVLMSNCVRQKTGAIQKRVGTGNLSKTATNFGTIGAGRGGGPHKNTMWMTDGINVYSWSDKFAVWQNQDKIPEAIALDRIQAAAFTAKVVDYDMAIGNGLLHVVVLAQAPTSTNLIIWDTVLDLSSFSSASGMGGLQQGVTATVVDPINIIDAAANAALAPKIVVCGTTSVLTYVRGTNLCCRTFDLSTPGATWSAEANLVGAISANAQTGVYDMCEVRGDAARFAVCVGVGGNTNLYICSVSSRSVTTGPKLVKAIDSFSTGMVAYNNSFYMVIVQDAANNANSFVGGYDEGTATILTSATVNVATIGTTGKCAIETAGPANQFSWIISTGFAVGNAAMNSGTHSISQVRYNTLTVVADIVTLPAGAIKLGVSTQLASRPVWVAALSKCYVALSIPSAVQGSSLLCEASLWADTTTTSQVLEPQLLAFRGVVTLAPRLQLNVPQPLASGGSFTLPHFVSMPSVPDVGSPGVYMLPTVFSTETFHNAIVAQPIDFASAIAYKNVPTGDSTAIATGMPVFYDGQITCEMGYPNYPEIQGSMAGAGGNLSAGPYQYTVVYEWYDTRGQIHRSAPSPVITLVAVNNDQATVNVSGCTPTMRTRLSPAQPLSVLPYTTHIYAILYRTTQSGTIFYRVTADPPGSANALFNGVGVQIIDGLSDANLIAPATAQVIYTTGGILGNMIPPSSRCIVQHANRVVLAGCDNPKQVWASKALTDGEAPGFHEQLAFVASGAVRALASMDGNLIMFVQRGNEYGIERVEGQGPTDSGTQSDWTPPIPIPSDVGAVDQRGVCTGPFGVLFRSPVGGPKKTGGLYLLSRDFQVVYVGKAVEDALAARPVVTSMVLHPDAGRVYITTRLSDSVTSSATTQTRIVWDYIQNCWSTDTLWDADAAASGLDVSAAWVAMVGGTTGQSQAATYHCLSPGGRVYRERTGADGAGAYMDSGTWVTAHYRGALWKASLGGFSRYWRLQLQADSLEGCDLTATLTFDGAPSTYYNEQDVWTSPQIAAFDRYPQVDVEMLVNNQKARSIQLDLVDGPPTGGGAVTGQGMSWAAVSLELGVKPGLYRNIPDGQRA